MKYSKLFPMACEAADDFIDRIASCGEYHRVEPLGKFPYLDEAKLLYFGPRGFMKIEKKAEEGQWKVTIET